jgi:hypothetical protein
MDKQKIIHEKKLQAVKMKIINLGVAIPGTIRMIYSKCGKANCACQTDKKARHGPYFLWDRKVNGKLSSKMVSREMAKKIKIWIENRKRLEFLIHEILTLGQEFAVTSVDELKKSEGENV